MMEHLIGNGHRRIAFCGETSPGPGRLHAWSTELNEHGFAAPASYVVAAGAYDLFSNAEKHQFVEDNLTRFLSLPEPPTAIFCTNDDLASMMILCCWQRGLRVPEDLSICGFDGSVAIALDSLALTTIRQPYEEIFDTALSLLRQQIPKNFPHVLLRPSLVSGKTVKNNNEPN